MLIKLGVPAFALLVLALIAAAPRPQPVHAAAVGSNAPAYTKDGRLLFPARYREWIFLSSGVDMSYNPKAQVANHAMFDNVFVNPEAYASFLQTGTWPDKTVMVLESRMGVEKGSINHRGHYQDTEVMGFEVHVKDASRFPGNWAFFNFDDQVSGSVFPPDAGCYSCHRDHAAVDTTFVQFYPTLLPIAKQKGTVSASYLKDEAEAK
jgi:hypothetical protein